MSATFYDQYEQDLSMVHESTLRTPEDDGNGSAEAKDTALAASYDLLKPMPTLPDGVDIELALRVKEFIHGLASGKYPSKVINAMREPVSFTLDGLLDNGVMLTYAIGLATTSGNDPYIQTIDEYINWKLESFTTHGEQKNTYDSAQDIIFDLFGCIVNDYTLSLKRDDSAIRQSVGIMSPIFAVGNALSSPIGEWAVEPFTWKDIDTTNTYLKIGATDYMPPSVNSMSIQIVNNVSFIGALGDDAGAYAINGKRDVILTIDGYIDDKTLFDFWRDLWDNENGYLTTAGGRMCYRLYLKKGGDANDYIDLNLYNLVMTGFNHHFSTADESIKGVTMEFKCATPSPTKKQFRTQADAAGLIIKDDNDNEVYHFNT